MKKFLSFFLILLFSSSLQAASKTEIILDVSGSMNKMLGAEKRIDAARKSIAGAMASIPNDAVVGLRLYSHRISSKDKAASCKDTELVVPFGPINKIQIQNIVNQAQPLGETPIAYSLEQASLDFGTASDEQAVIILVSDGEESCGGDPVAVAKSLIAKGFKIKIHSIGIDVDATARAQLEGISSATGGLYKDARDAASLSSSLEELTRDALLVQKTQTTYGDAIRGGDSYETAVSINPGKLYRLDHHQRKDQFDYFYIDLKGGQRLVATIETGENGVQIDSAINQATVAPGFPYAGIALHNNQRQMIGRQDIIGGQNEKKSFSFAVPASAEGRYYILVGSIYNNQHKDNRFQIEVQDMGDANSGRDAGDTEAAALDIQLGNYEKNFLSGGDKVDFYKFTPIANAAYEIKARSARPELSMEISLLDGDGLQIATTSSPNGGAAAKFENISFQKAGPVFIRIQSHYYTGDDEVPYSLSILSSTLNSTQTPVLNPTNGQNLTPLNSIPVVNKTIQGLTLRSVFDQMNVLEKLQWVFLYLLCPSFFIFLFGILFGYIWGRRSGKRKVLAQIQKTQLQAQQPK